MWKPPEDERITDSWQPPADEAIDQSVDNRRWDQKAAEFLQPLSDAADKITQTMPYVMGLANPIQGEALYLGNKINEAAGRVAEPVAELAAKHGVNPYAAAALGMGASAAVNPMSYTPVGALGAGKVLKPAVPAERAFDVATAQKYGLPMTRADYTGNIGTARVETGLSRTITGGPLFQKIAQGKLAAIERAKQAISNQFGTEQPLSAIGADAKIAMQGEMGAAAQTARDLYKQVPDVQIQVGNLEKAINELDFGRIDKGASATVQEIKARLSKTIPPTEQTVPTAGAQYSVKPVTPDLPVISDAPAQGAPYAVYQGNMDFGPGTEYSTYILRGEHPRSGGNFSAQDLVNMGIKVKGRTQRSLEMGHNPVNTPPELFPTTQTSPGFQNLNEIRNLLSKEIQSDTTYNPILGNQTGSKAQSLIPLKKALDQDLAQYVSRSKDPLGKMEAGEFETAFSKANTYYGALKGLQHNKFVQKLSRVPESDIPKTVFGTGRIEDVNVAKAAMGQKGFNAAKKQFFNDLLEAPNIETKLSKYEPEFLQGVFNPKELNALKEAASLKKTSLTAEKLAGNPSGTAQMLSSIATGGFLFDAARKAIAHPLHAAVEATATLGVPYLASKAYLASAEGIPASFGARSMAATKGATSASSSTRKDVHDEFIRRYIRINRD